MYQLVSESLQLSLHQPGDGFYAGTRFDRGGVFASLLFHGVEMAGPWFTSYVPTMHDAVQGPAEEFSAIGFDAAAPGETFLKVGVGLLRRPDDAPYDRFRLYEIADPGSWEVVSAKDRISFRHVLKGWYEYEKEIVLTGDSSFEIRHMLQGPVPLEGEVYNHNFFTFGKMAVGPSRQMDFPFRPAGDWRAVYDSVGFTDRGVRFSRQLAEGESVYTGNLHASGRAGMPYDLTIRETAAERHSTACPWNLSVHITGDVPVTHTVLWANHRIACLEPYNAFRTEPASSFHGLSVESPCRWTVRYTFLVNC